MKSTKIFLILIFSFFFNNSIQAKSPSLLITEIVDKASAILSSSDPVESKIIKLNDIAENNVDIDGIGFCKLDASDVVRHKLNTLQYHQLHV